MLVTPAIGTALNTLELSIASVTLFFQFGITTLQSIFDRYEHTGHVELLAAISGNMATAYAEQEQFEEALTHYQKAVTFNKRCGNVNGQATALCEIGIVHLRQGQFEQALARLQESRDIWQQLKSPDVEKAQQWIVRVERMMRV